MTVTDNSSLFTSKPLKIGAGGWLIGMDIAPDGTAVVRTDTYGAYLLNRTTATWSQLVTTTSMPSSWVNTDNVAGVYSIAIAPSNSSRMYMTYAGHAFVTSNKGATWTETGLTPYDDTNPTANDTHRTNGRKTAVDPANPDVVYVGTPQGGIFLSTNGGTSFSAVTGVPTSGFVNAQGYDQYVGHLIIFDHTSSVVGSGASARTQTIYASSYGNRIYRSTNGGTSWAQLTGGPTGRIRHASVAADGIVYFTCYGGSYTQVWKLSGTTWTDITDSTSGPNGVHSVTCDPNNAARIVVGGEGGNLQETTDRGATWSYWWEDNTKSLTATDVPWLAATNENFMSSGNMLFDPITPNQLFFSEGIGVWKTTRTSGQIGASVTPWTSISAGIEQLVANYVLQPPGTTDVFAACWDRPLYRLTNPDTYPSVVLPPNNTAAINMGTSIDYASSDNSFLIASIGWSGQEESAYSTNHGVTWTELPNKPTWEDGAYGGGTLVASTPTNWLWVPTNKRYPQYTKNAGATWTTVTLPGTPGRGQWQRAV
jgi:hypothetical protein